MFVCVCVCVCVFVCVCKWACLYVYKSVCSCVNKTPFIYMCEYISAKHFNISMIIIWRSQLVTQIRVHIKTNVF